MFRPVLSSSCLILSLTTTIVLIQGARADVPGWLVPPTGDTFQDQLKCYGLPYGGLGFGSHVLTYYTLICLYQGRRPLLPWMRLRLSKLDTLISNLGLVGMIIIASLTIFKCQRYIPLVLVAIGKISTSIAVACAPIRPEPIADRNGSNLWWLAFYAAFGTSIGMLGLFIIVYQTDRYMLFAFVGAAVVGCIMIAAWSWCCPCCMRNGWGHDSDDEYNDEKTGFGKPIVRCAFLTFVFGQLLGDWLLGFATRNFGGLPSSDTAALYWTYFAAKRLPMLVM